MRGSRKSLTHFGRLNRANFRRDCAVIINDLRPFPGIVQETVFHENWGEFDEAGTDDLVAWTKPTDPTRLVANCRGWNDEDPEIFINGILVAQYKGSVDDYVLIHFSHSTMRLNHGCNTIAIHVQQIVGGPYFDLGLHGLK